MRARREVGGREERATGETPTSHLGGIRNKGGREGGRSQPFLKEDTKAVCMPAEGRGQSRACSCLQDRPRQPAGSPGWRSDQGMWLLVFNFHLSQISLPKISGLKGRVGTSGSALRMRVWRSLTATGGCALGRDGPGVPLGL